MSLPEPRRLLMPSRHGLALFSCLLLVACSDSNDDSGPADPGATSPAEQSAMAVSSGAVCQVGSGSGTTIGTVDENGNLIPLSEEQQAEEEAARPDDLVDCFAFPQTNLSSSGLLPTGSGSVVFDSQEYTLSSAIRGVGPLPSRFPELDPPQRSYNDIILHDGETRVLRYVDSGNGRRIDYGVYDASVVISFALLPKNSENDPSGRVYDLVLDSTIEEQEEPALLGRDIAIDALLIIDLDGDGTISLPEAFLPTSGQIIWSETEDAPSFTFTFVLEDGRSIEGAYTGGYELIDLAVPPLD